MKRIFISRPRMLMTLAAACVLGAAIVSGCGFKGPPMDLSEFRWQCNFAGTTGSGNNGSNNSSDNDGGNTGCDPFYQEQVCQEYSARLEAFTGSLDQCLQLCHEVRDQLAADRVYHDDCQGVVVEVADVCNRYCRRNFQ